MVCVCVACSCSVLSWDLELVLEERHISWDSMIPASMSFESTLRNSMNSTFHHLFGTAFDLFLRYGVIQCVFINYCVQAPTKHAPETTTVGVW